MRVGISSRQRANGGVCVPLLTEGRSNMLEISPIGVIHSRYTVAKGTPVQPRWATESEGSVELLPEFGLGLRDLDGFDRVWLLYWFDRAKPGALDVVPYMDTQSHGIFATRAPSRPNPIGLSCVKLLAVEGNRLRLSEVDVLDGTPLLDIKPYVPAFDVFEAQRVGWYAHAKNGVSADDRFATQQDSFETRVRQFRAVREGE
jgi:tRNA (adenine37-N6)-methyltransferase